MTCTRMSLFLKHNNRVCVSRHMSHLQNFITPLKDSYALRSITYIFFNTIKHKTCKEKESTRIEILFSLHIVTSRGSQMCIRDSVNTILLLIIS